MMIGKASTTHETFSRETTVNIDIKADASVIWTLLTQAADYSRWNSTIVSIKGNIALGETIKLISTLDPKRTFKLKVKEWQPEQRLVWGDGQGQRVFTLTKKGNGIVNFDMTEKIGGFMFPLYKRFIPPFNENFEQFTSSLKKEAELIEDGGQ